MFQDFLLDEWKYVFYIIYNYGVNALILTIMVLVKSKTYYCRRENDRLLYTCSYKCEFIGNAYNSHCLNWLYESHFNTNYLHILTAYRMLIQRRYNHVRRIKNSRTYNTLQDDYLYHYLFIQSSSIITNIESYFVYQLCSKYRCSHYQDNKHSIT